MNGICIWHSPFEYRVSKLADYFYLPRNMFMLHTLYSPKFKKNFKLNSRFDALNPSDKEIIMNLINRFLEK